MANLGTLTLDLVARIGGYEAGLDKAEREAKKRAQAIERAFDNAFTTITAGFAILGSAGAAALVAVNAQAEAIAGYQDLADKVGDTAEAFASLQDASTISGVAMDTVAAASVRLTASLSKTDDESKLVGQAIKALGLEFDNFKKLSPVEQIDAVARALAGFEDGAEKTAVAVALFGKAGAELLPFLNDLADGAERNVRLTADQIKAADDYSKSVARLKAEFDGFIKQQAAGMVPVLSQVVNLLGELAKQEAAVSTVTEVMNAAVKTAITIFQTLVVVASDVGFVFLGVGREIGAWAAQLAALARLDLTGFRAISDAVKEDGKRARAELDAFQKRVMAIGQPAYMDDEIRRLQGRSNATTAPPPRPRLNIAGLSAGASAGGGAAKDPYADAKRYLEQLERQAEALQNLSVFEKTLKDIQLDRLGALTPALKEQILQLALQIDKTKEEQEAQKKLNAELEAQKKARDALAASMLAAQQAQQSYLDTLNKNYAMQLAGVGQGNKFREEMQGYSQVLENFEQKRQELFNDRRAAELSGPLSPEALENYERQLQLINETQAKALESTKNFYAQMSAAQGNWINGANEAFSNYIAGVKDVAGQTQELFGNAFKGIEDQFVNLFTGKKVDVKSLFSSITSDIQRMLVKQNITGPLAEYLQGGMKSGEGAGGAIGNFLTSLFGGGKGAKGDAALGGASAGAAMGLSKVTAAAELAANALLRVGGQSAVSAVTGSSGGGLWDSIAKLFTGSGSAAGMGSNFGFASGGYTGSGSMFQPAGIVHRGEYVLDAATTKRLGVSALDRLNNGGGMGGTTNNIYVTQSPGATRETGYQAARAMGAELQRARAR